MTSTTQPSAADLDAVAAETAIRQATVAPTLTEIDSAIARFEAAQENARAAAKIVDDEKAKLIFLVQSYGSVPAHAEQSKRLVGTHNEATITWSTSFTVSETGVDVLHLYLAENCMSSLFGRFFAPVTKYKMVEGARDVLKTLTLSNRHREKIAQLVGLAIDVKTSAPSLKVKTIQPEKPVRTKKVKAA